MSDGRCHVEMLRASAVILPENAAPRGCIEGQCKRVLSEEGQGQQGVGGHLSAGRMVLCLKHCTGSQENRAPSMLALREFGQVM